MYLKPWPSSPIRFSAGISRFSKNSSLVSWLTMLGIGRTVRPWPIASRRSTMKIDMPSRLLLHLGQRRGARQQDHQVGVLHARDPDLLAVDDVAVALLHRGGLDLGRVGAGGRLGHAHRLQAQLAAGDLRQVALLLRLGAVAQQRAHVVHLAVAGAGVAAGAVDLLHDHRRLGEAQARSRRTPAGSARRASRPWSARRRRPRGSRARRRPRGSTRRETARTARARRRGSRRGEGAEGHGLDMTCSA